MTIAERLQYDWKEDLRLLFGTARQRLVISSPYVTGRGADFMLSEIADVVRPALDFTLLTDLSPLNVAQAATDPVAIRRISAELPRTQIIHLPRVHAKVYIQDAETAIVTSGNLTAGGLEINYEYGVKVLDAPTAASIDRDIRDYAVLGALVPIDVLCEYSDKAAELRNLYSQQERAVRRADVRFHSALASATDTLLSLRLAGGAMHTVFSATVLYLLAKHGPMPTTQLHPRIAAIHPDLCDDNVDRIIDGKSYGKKWKHAVRTAQQQLKKRGQITLIGEVWTLADDPSPIQRM